MPVCQVDLQEQGGAPRYGVLVIQSPATTPSETNRAFQPEEQPTLAHAPSVTACDDETHLTEPADVTFRKTQSYAVSFSTWSAIKSKLFCPCVCVFVSVFRSAVKSRDSSVQFKMVSMRSEKPICAPPRLSEVSPSSPLKRFQCSSDWRWPSLVLSRKIV